MRPPISSTLSLLPIAPEPAPQSQSQTPPAPPLSSVGSSAIESDAGSGPTESAPQCQPPAESVFRCRTTPEAAARDETQAHYGLRPSPPRILATSGAGRSAPRTRPAQSAGAP